MRKWLIEVIYGKPSIIFKGCTFDRASLESIQANSNIYVLFEDCKLLDSTDKNNEEHF